MLYPYFLINSANRIFSRRFNRIRVSNFSKYLISGHFTRKNMNTKSPNILVYTGNSCPKLFRTVENNLSKCLKTDNYVVYHLLPTEIGTQPWMENSLLLIISSDTVENCIASAFEIYFKNFGNILLVCSKFNNSFLDNTCDELSNEESLVQISYKHIGDVCILRGKYSYNSDNALCLDENYKPLIRKIICNENILITSEVYLERDPDVSHRSSGYNRDKRILILRDILSKEFGLEVKNDEFMPQLSAGYIFCDIKSEIVKIMNHLNLDDISSLKSIFHECSINSLEEQIKLPIYFYSENSFKLLNFDKKLYFSNLQSDIYGHSLVYFPVITSTMEVAEQLSEYEGIVITADYQICGRGRGSNKWISPVGCAMFTLHFTVPLFSNLGRKLTLLQHIASLAVVQGIKSQQIYKDLELKVKWPNDIYHGKTKLGGLIVTSVIQKDSAHVNVGWGINVSNSCPTSCLNDVIDKYNSENSCSLPHLHIEEIIAFTVSQMEFYIKDFINSGPEKFFKYYYSYWMHSNQKITLTNLNQKGTIIGLDEYGFLKIETNDGKILVLQPDGNRFDIMKNLIYSRAKPESTIKMSSCNFSHQKCCQNITSLYERCTLYLSDLS